MSDYRTPIAELEKALARIEDSEYGSLAEARADRLKAHNELAKADAAAVRARQAYNLKAKAEENLRAEAQSLRNSIQLLTAAAEAEG